jgi:hypothetical protein
MKYYTLLNPVPHFKTCIRENGRPVLLSKRRPRFKIGKKRLGKNKNIAMGTNGTRNED